MRMEELEVARPQAGIVAVDGKVFPLESVQIRARARGGIAETTLRQAFRNPYAEALEALYTLPLPADGAVIGFDIRLGEKTITGEVEAYDKALKKYREALETGRLAGILEQVRADTFSQTLGNVPPGTRVDVEIRVLQPVTFHGGAGGREAEWEYRFPTVVGTRYEGAPGRVRDRDRLDVDRADATGTPVRLTMDLEIGDGAPSTVTPRSGSHSILVDAGEKDGTTHVQFKDASRLDRDVTVSWRAAKQEIGLDLVEGPGLKGDDGRYALLTIVPPNAPDQIFARDVTLLIDASGSMSGPSIEAARELSSRVVGSLTARDRFQILAFSTNVERIVGTPTEATPENIEKAQQALARIEAGGATEMSHAVEEGLRAMGRDTQRQVVLLTDGYIGFEQEIVKRILDDLPTGARLHVVGIGSAPNRSLTRGASRAGRGVEVLVEGIDGIEMAAARLLAATVAPVLTDIVVEGSGVLAVATDRPRDVLAGQPVVIALELNPKGGEILIRGAMQGTIEEWSLVIHASTENARMKTDLPIGAIFGRDALEDEEMNLATTMPESREVMDRIQRIGLRHRITSRCTTLVAVAEEPSVDPRQPRRRERLPVEMPAGVNPEAVGYAAPRSIAALLAPMPAMRSARMSGAGRRAPTLGSIEEPLGLRIAARCIRTEGDLLVLEFESPEDRFRLPGPGSRMTLIADGGTELEVRVDRKLSTHAGPHARGLTLRLAVRRVDGLAWGGRIRLRYRSGRQHEITANIT